MYTVSALHFLFASRISWNDPQPKKNYHVKI